MITEQFLRILRCPISRQPLNLADEELVTRINKAIKQRRVVNRLGETITRNLDAGLTNEAGTLLYAIHDEIPCLIVDEAIELEHLSQMLSSEEERSHERKDDLHTDH